MDKLTEIKEKLNAIYEEYKANKSQLNNDKTKKSAKLISEMTFSDDGSPSDVAFELSRFSAEVVKTYFEYLTESAVVSIEVLDEILREFMATDKDKAKSQYYVPKFVFAVTSIVKSYGDRASESKQLPRLVTFIAKFAVKSDKNKNKFRSLINNTNGEIFMLDYSDINKNSLVNIWNVTKNIFPDLSGAKYESFITEWGVKYGFLHGDKVTAPDTDSAEEQIKKTEEETEKVHQPKKRTKFLRVKRLRKNFTTD